MYQQKQLEEIKRKQEYVLSSPFRSSPLPHACPLLPLHAAVCGCFLSLCAEEFMTAFSMMQCCWFALLREFAERQKSKRVAIAAKILEEEQLVNRRKRHQAVLPKPSTTDSFPSLGRAREKLLRYLDPSPQSATKERATIVSGSLHLRQHLGNNLVKKTSALWYLQSDLHVHLSSS